MVVVVALALGAVVVVVVEVVAVDAGLVVAVVAAVLVVLVGLVVVVVVVLGGAGGVQPEVPSRINCPALAVVKGHARLEDTAAARIVVAPNVPATLPTSVRARPATGQ